jgi:hypothetical protein
VRGIRIKIKLLHSYWSSILLWNTFLRWAYISWECLGLLTSIIWILVTSFYTYTCVFKTFGQFILLTGMPFQISPHQHILFGKTFQNLKMYAFPKFRYDHRVCHKCVKRKNQIRGEIVTHGEESWSKKIKSSMFCLRNKLTVNWNMGVPKTLQKMVRKTNESCIKLSFQRSSKMAAEIPK